MAKAINAPRHGRQDQPVRPDSIAELVNRLEALATVAEETRSQVFTALGSGDVPDYASAYEALVVAVALLAPKRASQIVSHLAAR